MGRSVDDGDVSPEKRTEVIGFLEALLGADGKPVFGAKSRAARRYDLHRNTIASIWKNRGESPRKKRPGPSRKYDPEAIRTAIKAVPIQQRSTIRSAAASVKMAPTTVHRYVSGDGPLRSTTVHVKPALTDEQKRARLEYVLKFVESPMQLRRRYFDDMHGTVHIDEKWFFVHKVSSRYILADDEEAPHLVCANKRFITKVMFLAAVARPRYNYDRAQGFDGKIGIFPLIAQRVAKRTTKNQTKGDIITVPVAVDRHVYYQCLVEQVLPAIKAKWPAHGTRMIYLQQDNASPHVTAEDAVRDANLDGWNVVVRRQPARSPDLNVLDLGFFNAIQSLQHQKQAYSVDSLIGAVCDAFNEMKIDTLEKCFLTLQAVMGQIMVSHGDNNYKLPRVSSRFDTGGVFPSALVCSESAYSEAKSALAITKTSPTNT